MAPSTKEPRTGRPGDESRREAKRIDRSRLDAIVGAIAALPVVDGRAPDELIGYDEGGLPWR